MKTTTVLIIDARSRSLGTFSASATCIGGRKNRIILRKAAEVGKIQSLYGQKIDCPILVVGGYQAQSSEGYAKTLGGENFQSVLWIGGSGFGWEKESGHQTGDGLRTFNSPQMGILLPAGSEIKKIPTHKNSNVATAQASLYGLQLRARGQKSLVIAEGQSDYTSGIEIMSHGSESEDYIFSPEHREDIFMPANLARKYLGRISDSQKFFISLIISSIKEERVGDKKSLIKKISGVAFSFDVWSFIEEGAEALMSLYLQAGWSWQTEFSSFECKGKIISPEKVEESFSFSMKGDEENYHTSFYLVDNFLSSNQNEIYLTARRAEMIQLGLNYFSSNDEWDRKMLRGFSNGKSFSVGELLHLEDGREEIYLLKPVYTGENLQEVLTHSGELATAKIKNYLCLVALDESSKIIGYRVLCNREPFGYARLGGVIPVSSVHYKSKKQKAEEILALLKTFGKISDEKFGNMKRSHSATYLRDEEDKIIAGVCGNGSDYITPSLQAIAGTEDLTDWVFQEPFRLEVSSCTRGDIKDDLLKKAKELNLNMIFGGSF